MSESSKLHCRPVGRTSTRGKAARSQLSNPWWPPRRGPGQGEHLARSTRTWMYCALSSESGQDQNLADSALPLARRQKVGPLPGVGEKQKPIRFADPGACKWREVRQGPAGTPFQDPAGTYPTVAETCSC
jgi:hypothetical protein